MQKNGFFCRSMHFPAEKCIFPQKNALSCRKMRLFLQKNALSCRKMRLSGGTSQEIAGRFQVSRIKNASQLSKDTMQTRVFACVGSSCLGGDPIHYILDQDISKFALGTAIDRSPEALPKKSQKGLPRPPGLECQKSVRKSKTTRKRVKK